MIEEGTKGNGVTGLIPDFFHDVIAYLIPGYTVISFLLIDVYVVTHKVPLDLNNFNMASFFFFTVLAYVIGRFLEQVGYKFIHHRKFPFLGESNKIFTPKWTLVFDDNDKSYTKTFKSNIVNKIEEWLDKQNGKKLIEECKQNKKDDYFNIIQFYLRERFPLVALYEKKQNATIVLTRSLAVWFMLNTIVYFLILYMFVPSNSVGFSLTPFVWIVVNVLFSIVFYSRFKLDKKYHAMYIYETFIAMKKLLKKKDSNNSSSHQEPARG